MYITFAPFSHSEHSEARYGISALPYFSPPPTSCIDYRLNSGRRFQVCYNFSSLFLMSDFRFSLLVGRNICKHMYRHSLILYYEKVILNFLQNIPLIS
jgi:hypothetical protein